MHLKLIEIIGFKSFADKTRIELDDGFTAIVGPNGSGKSNITEAIKWVLGEQSAKSLRGHKMDDVIFAGAKDRNRGQYAEVSLVFDNQDRTLDLAMDEVSVTRRFTRSGESDYAINRRACRLKDITELMLDTGVGRDSFSIISQGKVEAIFTQKAEDRRGIFEEAAGVMKYKTRKKEAERKLMRAEENLQRIYDILSEVEDRLEPLETQRKAALHYQDQKAALSEIEIALTVVQVETNSEQWEMAKNDLSRCLADIAAKKKQLVKAQQLLTDYHQQEQTAETAINQAQETYVTVVQKAEQVQAKLQMLAQQAAFNKRDQESQQAACANLEAEISSAKANMLYLHAQMVDMDKTYSEQQAALATIKTELTRLGSDEPAVLETTRNQYIEALQQQSQLSNRITQAEKDLRSQTLLKTQQTQQIAELTGQLQTAETELQQKEKGLTECQKRLEQLRRDYQARTAEQQQLSETYHQVKQQTTQIAQEVMRLSARKQSLEELEREKAGFNQGVKAALNLQNQLAGIHGAIAQLISVPAQYTTAVEIALGASMQNIVTANSQVASQVISELKRDRAGRATFLPLELIKARSVTDQTLTTAKKTPGFIGVLVDLVDFEAQYQAIMANLMGQILVVDNLENGRQLAQASQYRYRIVSLAGDIINAGGSMTGGAYKRQGSGLLSRKADIDQLGRQIETATRQQAGIAALEQEQAQQLAALQQALTEIKAAGDEVRFLEKTLQQEQQHLQAQQAQQQAALVACHEAQSGQAEAETLLTTAYEADQQALNTVESKISQLKAAMANLNLSATAKEKKRVELQSRHQEMATNFAVLTEQKKQLCAQYQEQQTATAAQEHNYRALSEQLQMLATTAPEADGSIAELQQQQQLLAQQQQALNGELKRIRQEKQAIYQKREATEHEVSHLNEKLQSLLTQQVKTEATAARYEVAIDNHLERLSEEYGLTFERARAESELTMSIEAAANRVRQLKKEIEAIGPVNLTAIDEYSEVYERYIFMVKQRDDVLAAKENLFHTMVEMDKEVSSRFSSTFAAIRAEFAVIFPKLFGGGKASLELTDSNQLLTTGIEIIAQPPGKRLQHLSLLSGGEKALTAIALLFAILQVKTVPFSILDEVEAALDEANVSRFGRFLREFMTKTQFIVITHRKGTMAEANILYGVTMQQSGVSKLASIKLTEFDEADELTEEIEKGELK